MKSIGLFSDTHSFLPHSIFDFFKDCDEVWHAGDIGNEKVAEKMEAFKPFKAVYGNIDAKPIRGNYPLDLRFKIEDINVWITHIGGYPGKYNPRITKSFQNEALPDLFICGHSHILKVMKDPLYGFLHINPGAAGIQGFHQILTAIRFKIEGKRIFDLEVNNICYRKAVTPEMGILYSD
ncbi:MAG: metallophosphoesterase family protein [Bacteroidetes bacterium]|jgi:putative phosphoesterase|nr:metallophosphoesterase family protein [Bacteroidota bacterium]MBP7255936.1 metallophosphoesterase family protein [Chitinophagales bacterium]MBK7505171.1 metallophosphoesterase family protein [Bacteroidota bacterium]MBK8673418.1 metallophosphoesterase family protein [Bacteroidota bacterium]MBK9355503.1 metallophosphoesterase family protein [Bacteroidota bacterium]